MVDPQAPQDQGSEHPALAPLPDEAWDEKRDELEQLYLVEDRDLKDIIEIMKNQGFLATRKQYLRHFKRWRIEKNIKTHEYRAMVRIQNRRLAEGKQTEFTVRKRPVPRDKISRFLRKYDERSLRNQDDLEVSDPPTPPDIEYGSPPLAPTNPSPKSSPPDDLRLDALPVTAQVYFQTQIKLNLDTRDRPRLRPVTPSLIDPRLRGRSSPPQTLLFPERIILSIHDYIGACLSSGAWTINQELGKVVFKAKPPCDPFTLLHFTHLMEEATDRLRAGQVTADTFRLLNIAFSMLKSILIDEDPQALHNILSFYFEFCFRSTHYPDLSRIFVTYCIELTSTVLGQQHPIAAILRQLSSMNLEDGMQCTRRVYRYIQDEFIAHFGVLDPRTVSYELATLRKITRLPTDDICPELEDSLRVKAELEQSNNTAHKSYLWWVNLALAELYIDETKEYEKARQILEELDQASLGPGVRLLWTLRLGEAVLGLGEAESAVEQFTSAMRLCQHNSETLRVLGFLERAHIMCGNTEGTMIVQQHIQSIIGEMEMVARSFWDMIV